MKQRTLVLRWLSSSPNIVITSARRNSSSTTTENGQIVLDKITARVFCQEEGKGGNPVTIFIPSRNHIKNNTITSDRSASVFLSSTQQSKLAQTCSWESVFVNIENNNSSTISGSSINNIMKFYLPSGTEVSFCAHAAMGGSMALSSYFNNNNTGSSGTSTTLTSKPTASETTEQEEGEEMIDFSIETAFGDDENDNTKPVQLQSIVYHPYNIVSLILKLSNHIVWKESKIEYPPALHRLVRGMHNIESSKQLQAPIIDIVSFPTFVNASIFNRPKTLVYVSTSDILNKIVSSPPTSSADHFMNACDAMKTTGLYFYTKATAIDQEPFTYECVRLLCVRMPSGDFVFLKRQFPRASGYPEDPATGVAAAALAISIANRFEKEARINGGMDAEEALSTIQELSFHFHQGYAMGQPSVIRIENVTFAESLNLTPPPSLEEEEDDDDEENEQLNASNQAEESTAATTNPEDDIVSRLVSLNIMGKVVIDHQETIEISTNE